MKKIAFYGKGGIGKSTTVSNLASALARQGYRVFQIGCDPKADSTVNHNGGERIPTILDVVRQGGGDDERDFLRISPSGVYCMEAGGPLPGTGCAGRGIVAALREIQDRGLLEDRDVVLYDVLGDVVCGGFSMPLREAIADDVYLVTTSDFMAVYAANNICRGVKKYAESGGVRLSGVVYNGRSGRDDPSVALRFARLVGTELAGEIPMSPLIGRAELERRTVLEAYPDSPVSQSFRALASHMYARGARCIPTPLSDEEVESLCRG